MKRVIWSDRAIADLRAIRGFLDEKYDPSVSRSAIEQLVLGGRLLLEYPAAGAPLPQQPWRKWRPRGSFQLLIYRPARDGIEIARVRHASEDWRTEP